MSATDQQDVTAAANRIDQELKYDADRKGYAVDNYRLFRVVPLGVLFTVSKEDRVVRVYEVMRVANE